MLPIKYNTHWRYLFQWKENLSSILQCSSSSILHSNINTPKSFSILSHKSSMYRHNNLCIYSVSFQASTATDLFFFISLCNSPCDITKRIQCGLHSTQYRVCPPLASRRAAHLQHIDITRLATVACGMLSHSSWSPSRNLWMFSGTGTRSTTRSRASQRCSMGRRSEEYGGSWEVECPPDPGRPCRSWKRGGEPQDFISVPLPIQVAIDKWRRVHWSWHMPAHTMTLAPASKVVICPLPSISSPGAQIHLLCSPSVSSAVLAVGLSRSQRCWTIR